MVQNILEVDHVSKTVHEADGVLTTLHDKNFQLQAREAVEDSPDDSAGVTQSVR